MDIWEDKPLGTKKAFHFNQVFGDTLIEIGHLANSSN